jgi:hypothetical protein
VQFAVVQATHWNSVFVADLAAERARLGEANVVRFARHPAAYDTGPGREISAMLLVAKPNRLGGDATAAVIDRPLRRHPSHRFLESLRARRLDIVILCGACPSATASPSSSVKTLSRKLASTLSASVAINVFLTARFV